MGFIDELKNSTITEEEANKRTQERIRNGTDHVYKDAISDTYRTLQEEIMRQAKGGKVVRSNGMNSVKGDLVVKDYFYCRNLDGETDVFLKSISHKHMSVYRDSDGIITCKFSFVKEDVLGEKDAWGFFKPNSVKKRKVRFSLNPIAKQFCDDLLVKIRNDIGKEATISLIPAVKLTDGTISTTEVTVNSWERIYGSFCLKYSIQY